MMKESPHISILTGTVTVGVAAEAGHEEMLAL